MDEKDFNIFYFFVAWYFCAKRKFYKHILNSHFKTIKKVITLFETDMLKSIFVGIKSKAQFMQSSICANSSAPVSNSNPASNSIVVPLQIMTDDGAIILDPTFNS